MKMFKNIQRQLLLFCILGLLCLQCEGGKKKKKTKKIKKPPITILESNNRTHVHIEAVEATCTKTIEVLKKNETEDIELGLAKFDIVTGFGDVYPETWYDLAYPPVSPEQIKTEKKYYKYLSEDPDTTEKKPPLLHANDIRLDTLNHFLFEGDETYEDFRTLVPGGGTGFSTLYLAEQLNETNAEIVYVDASSKSMEIAQTRAKIRGLSNIIWIKDKMNNMPQLGLQTDDKFDFVSCQGVLHHMKIPLKGLNTLKDALHDEGGMDLMLYARYGRTGVEQMQLLMRLVNEGVYDLHHKIENTKKIYKILPSTNWFKKGESLTTDHLVYGDAGFYDLFLHEREFIYSVTELYELMKQAGLQFVEYYKKPRELLKPGNWITDEELIGKINDFEIVRQRHIAEIITGNLVFHEFYVSKMPNSTDTSRNVDEITYNPGKHTMQLDAYRI